MDKSIKEYSGRAFSSEEISLIQWTVSAYPKLTRIELAQTVCEFLDWTQISGKPKTRQCLTMLNDLQDKGLVVLPAPIKTKKKATNSSQTTEPISDTHTESEYTQPETVTECGRVELSIAQTPAEHRQWREYVKRYHMLGCPTQFGAQLRYFVRSNGQDLGCLQFSASAWALSARDGWIGWDAKQKKDRLHLIVNNSRFLILPWVQVKNLASRALSRAASRIQSDWLRIYCYEPVLLETFVDTTRYQGTCYKASNWLNLGCTQGRGRQDRQKLYALTQKAIYMYPLQKDFREILKGEKPYKSVSPDE